MPEFLQIDSAYWVLSPELLTELGAAAPRWEHQARTFFGSALEVFDDHVRVAGEDTKVRIRRVASCEAILAAARVGAAKLGGFDVLVARTKCVIEIDATGRGLLVAAIAASTVLGPILCPDGVVLGVKSARERLAHLGHE